MSVQSANLDFNYTQKASEARLHYAQTAGEMLLSLQSSMSDLLDGRAVRRFGHSRSRCLMNSSKRWTTLEYDSF